MTEGRKPVADDSDPVACFDSIYEANSRALHAYFLGRTSDPEAALDLSQEAFLRTWRNVSKLRVLSPERRRYWLYAVAKNLVADHHRGLSSRRAARQRASAETRWTRDREAGPQGALESRERIEAVDRAMQALPEELRTALTVRVLGGLSSPEIGEALGVPAGTIRYRISVARRHLAELLRLDEEDPGG
ncbi:MAG: RNA polymerase sigma factor [Actinomycetota bacterium]|nr:RNA polymerase sigma factor [Actinomycetota bacterium]